MAISNTYTYNPTRNIIIQDALNLIGVLGAEQSILAPDLQLGNRFLNNLLKSWGAAGLHIWKRQEAYLIPTPNQAAYSLGTNGDVAVSSYVQTYTTEVEIITDTVIHLVETAGFTVGMNTIIIDNNGNNFLSTIVAVDHILKTITLDDPVIVELPEGTYVYGYDADDRIVRPLKVLSVRRRTVTTQGIPSAIDVPLEEISYDDYFQLPFKASEGLYPTQYMYNPERDQDGTLYLWVTPNSAQVIFPFTYEITLADISSANQTFDVPQEWLMALTYKLAVALAPAYGATQQLAVIKPLAEEYYQDVLAWDNETVSWCIEPNWRN
jgi:hypothetical protein